MIVQLTKDVSAPQREGIIARLATLGYQATSVRTQRLEYIVAIGKRDIDIREIGHLAGVSDIHRVSDPYKLVSRKWKVRPSAIDLGDGVCIVEGECALMAGPCSIESEEQVRSVAKHLKEQGLRIMRGGAFKPRTSPYTFRGHGIEGLAMFKRIANEHVFCSSSGKKVGVLWANARIV